MSWQTYVDEHLMCDIEGNVLTSAAIIGHDGTVWAQSASFPQVGLMVELGSENVVVAHGLLLLLVEGVVFVNAKDTKSASLKCRQFDLDEYALLFVVQGGNFLNPTFRRKAQDLDIELLVDLFGKRFCGVLMMATSMESHLEIQGSCKVVFDLEGGSTLSRGDPWRRKLVNWCFMCKTDGESSKHLFP
ncbi:hypothetical protein RJ639_029070 [Escallonia herrerae]|uniref:Profilin n=1 Tax=Escallonia herrerae TaxID=1293975 RepID=A0AA88XEN0_9ASTE|nr:hypothetical protein RJ639_029070 [Escallonia herrerae]